MELRTCQGGLQRAGALLRKAIDLVGRNEVQLMALNDPDLEPWWKELEEI